MQPWRPPAPLSTLGGGEGKHGRSSWLALFDTWPPSMYIYTCIYIYIYIEREERYIEWADNHFN